MSVAKRKLIEVALPLEAINRESAREKSIRHGHPSTLHLWWARRPLAACRAVLFAQLVDDPSAHPDQFPTEEDQAQERRRLFDLIERLVKWENTTDEALLKQAHAEIAACFDGKPPAILDPFAGGGSIPLEAQRLGLEAHASDLNPVAVLINKALIEIPPKFAGRPPVFPGAAESRLGDWPHATGLAEDVRRYGQWMRDEAERRIGHLYPKAKLPNGTKANVIAWIWARTVTCPNPSCGVDMPLVSTLWLSTKRDHPTWLRPIVGAHAVRFEVVIGGNGPPASPKRGQGASFVCLACDTPAHRDYIHDQFTEGNDGAQLIATVAASPSRRVYLQVSPQDLDTARLERPTNGPDQECRGTFGGNAQGRRYGFWTFADYFTNRQLVTLMTLSDLVGETWGRVLVDADAFGLSSSDAKQYADAVRLYLGIGFTRTADLNNSLVTWSNSRDQARNLFSRQAIPMAWDFAEVNPFANAAGDIGISLTTAGRVIEKLPAQKSGYASQADAAQVQPDRDIVIATDPPYYDNIGYADLADFFYVWLRRALGSVYPHITGTMLTPKSEELVADSRRFGRNADEHFENGFVRTFARIRQGTASQAPITLFYAFKQTESDESGTASTGWETMLKGLIEAGLAVTATWPVRTERSGRSVGVGTNALASSVVLACRPRPEGAPATTRRAFLAALTDELPTALKELQQGSIAPVDLAQAAIGPGMAIYSRYAKVVEPDGSDMTVRMALALINQALDEVLSEQEGDFDRDTRFCVKWFTQFGWGEGEFGDADQLARATNTSVDGVVDGGVFWAKAGKARLLRPDELSADWDPGSDDRVSVWEVVVRMGQDLQASGIESAARLMAQAGQQVDLDTAKELAYLLFSICEKRRDTKSALLFNSLGTSWSDLSAAARTGGVLTPPPAQGELDFDALEE